MQVVDTRWEDLYRFAKKEYGDFGMNTEALWAFRFLHERFLVPGQGVIEIGAGFGASFHCWGSFFRTPYISIDVPSSLPGDREAIVRNREKKWKQHLGEVFPLQMHSQDPATVYTVQAILQGQQVDWLFIDGEHSYEAAISDFRNYSRFVRPGGLVGMHDIVSHDTVAQAWNELRGKTYWETLEGGGFGIIQI